MTDLETIAIAKVIKDAAIKRARRELEAGKNQEVDVLVRVFGTINIGDDYDRTPTASIPLLDALALAIHDAGITGQAAVNAIMRGMTRALEMDEDSKLIIGSMRENLDAAERKIRAGLEELPKVPCKGAVTTSLTVEEYEPVLA